MNNEEEVMKAELVKEMLAELNKPPMPNKVEREKHRKRMAEQLAAHYQSSSFVSVVNQGQKIGIVRRTVEESIKRQIEKAVPGISKKELARPLVQLIPRLERFDWRSLLITPFVRNQSGCGSCWAHAATAAFESSLMLQRANFEPTLISNDQRIPIRTLFSLSVESTLDSVEDGVGRCEAGRHERAFTHFVDHGVPLAGLSLSVLNEEVGSVDGLDFKLTPEEHKKNLIKAIAWDYVLEEPQEIPSDLELKTTLLEHGPLVVMLTFDNVFSEYGKLKEGEVTPEIPKDEKGFPIDTAPVFHGRTRQAFPDHYVLLIGWDDAIHAWIVQSSYGTNWGYQCDGPRVMNNASHSEDRGFMYICRNCNDVGAYAAWIEAPLLTPDDIGEIERFRFARIQTRGSLETDNLPASE